MNEWEKRRLRKQGYSEVAIWEIKQHIKNELKNSNKKENDNLLL